jgi:DNA (cytosine-5)-methyltransferase 1
MGYHRAGFDVTGVDIVPQPRYPFRFVQADALEYLAEHAGEYAAIGASPPCQAYSDMSNCRPGLADEYPELIEPVRILLKASRKPYVIENVIGAGLTHSDDLFGRYGALLCGRMFGLKLYRHRAFETSFPIATPAHPKHTTPASKAGYWEPGTIISVSGHVNDIAEARAAMGIDWMTREELAESIPPQYTEYIGAQLLDHVRAAV